MCMYNFSLKKQVYRKNSNYLSEDSENVEVSMPLQYWQL